MWEEVFAEAYRLLDGTKFEDQGARKAWIHRIATNVCGRYIRKTENRKRSRKMLFAEVMGCYEKVIRQVCRQAEFEKSKTDELFQEATTRIYQSLDNFQGRSSLRTWVVGVTKNVCKEHIRKAVRQPVEQREAGDNPDVDVGINPDLISVDAKMEEKIDAKIMLEYIMNNFSMRDQAIMYFYFLEYKYSEIANIQGMTAFNVAQRISRIKKKVIKYMNKSNC